MHVTPPTRTLAQESIFTHLCARAYNVAKDAANLHEEGDIPSAVAQLTSAAFRDLILELSLARDAGHAPFRVLVHTATGTVVATDMFAIRSRAAFWSVRDKWSVLTEHMNLAGNRMWIPCGPRSRKQKQYGLHEEFRYFPAEIKTVDGLTALVKKEVTP